MKVVVCVLDMIWSMVMMIWHRVWRNRMGVGVVSSWVKVITNQMKRILDGSQRTQDWNWCRLVIWVQEWE